MNETTQPLNLADWQAADQALRELGLCQLALTAIQAVVDARVNLAKGEARAASVSYRGRMGALQRALELFWMAHGAETEPGKSHALTFGVLGMRTARAVRLLPGWTIDQVIEALGQGFGEFLRVSHSVDREAVLAARPDQLESLKQCGLSIEEGERFFAEPDLEKIWGVASNNHWWPAIMQDAAGENAEM